MAKHRPSSHLLLAVSQLAALSLALPTASAFRASASPIRIDCGATTPSTLDGRAWQADAYFDGGRAFTVAAGSNLNAVESTLRSFPPDKMSCYVVPVPSGRYLVRLGFAYADYDGQNHSPRFNVLLHSTVVEVVDMDLVQKQYEASGEAYYTDYFVYALEGTLPVCLQPQPTRNGDGIYPPVLNSLEVLPADTDAYDASGLGQDIILSTYVRINMGGPALGPEPQDPGFRTWRGDVAASDGNYSAYANSQTITDTDAAPDYLPELLFQTARTARAPTYATGFRLTVAPVSPGNKWYARFYFAELDADAKAGDRIFQILIGSGTSFKAIGSSDRGFDILSVSPTFGAVVVPVFFDFSSSSQSRTQDLELGVKTVEGSRLPAIINAVELFEVVPVADTPLGSSSSGLTAWQIALIVVAALLGLVLLFLLVACLRRRRTARRRDGFIQVGELRSHAHAV